MTKGDLTMDDMLRKALRGFLGLLKQLLTNLLSEDGGVWEKELKKFLRKEPCWMKMNQSENNLFGFFETQEGLSVSDQFFIRILSPARKMAEVAPATVGNPLYFLKRMYDDEIRERLGDGHVFENARAFCCFLATAITSQWGGTLGRFTTNGSANLFYVRADRTIFVVDVRWSPSYKNWAVEARTISGLPWVSAEMAFPCADAKAA